MVSAYNCDLTQEQQSKKQDAGKRKTTMWTVTLVMQAETLHVTRTPGTKPNTDIPTVVAIGRTTPTATKTTGKFKTAERDASRTASDTIVVIVTTEAASD